MHLDSQSLRILRHHRHDRITRNHQIRRRRLKQLARLPFLDAYIRETLRLLPPANGKTAQRTAPAGTIAGLYLLAGIFVSADLYTIQRSPGYLPAGTVAGRREGEEQ
ncbi:averantin hydroxylase [Apiospora sp. TS-2023a]